MGTDDPTVEKGGLGPVTRQATRRSQTNSFPIFSDLIFWAKKKYKIKKNKLN